MPLSECVSESCRTNKTPGAIRMQVCNFYISIYCLLVQDVEGIYIYNHTSISYRLVEVNLSSIKN
jgi:hypothetical protein